MNFKTILSTVLITGSFLSASVLSAASTVSTATSDVASYSAPTPVTIVAPSGIARRFQGETIRLSLTIDETGQPRNIALLSQRDPNLVRNLLPAIARWRFTPAMKNGRPVSTDVVLPIELVDQSTS
jgi:TonB family protein